MDEAVGAWWTNNLRRPGIPIHSPSGAEAVDPRHPNFLGTEESRTFVFLVVDSDSDSIIDGAALPVHVGKFSKSPSVRHRLQYTAGGAHLDMPRGDARGFVDFSISGVSGLWPTGNHAGSPDGVAALRAVEAMFDRLLVEDVSGGFGNRRVSLEFIDLGAPASKQDLVGDSSFKIVPRRGVQISRDARRPGVYSFSLSFTGYERTTTGKGRTYRGLEAGAKESLLRDMKAFVARVREFDFDTMFVRYKMAISPAIQVGAAASDVAAFADRWSRGVDEFIGYNFGLVRGLIDDIGDIADTIRKFGMSWGERFSEDGMVLRELGGLFKSLKNMFHGAKTHKELTASTVQGEAIGVRTGAGSGGLNKTQLAAVASGQRYMKPGDRWGGRGARSAALSEKWGTTIAPVTAGRTIGDFVPSGFTEAFIIGMNNLVWPFVDSSRARPDSDPAPSAGDPRVVYLGEVVRVPVINTAASVVAGGTAPGASAVERPKESEDDRLFGADIMLDSDRNIVFDDSTGDLRVVSGIPNLIQGLKTRLSCPVAGLKYSPGFGSHVIPFGAGSWLSSGMNRMVAIMAHRTLTADPRVSSVDSIEVSSFDGKVEVSFDLTAIQGTPGGRVALAV